MKKGFVFGFRSGQPEEFTVVVHVDPSLPLGELVNQARSTVCGDASILASAPDGNSGEVSLRS